MIALHRNLAVGCLVIGGGMFAVSTQLDPQIGTPREILQTVGLALAFPVATAFLARAKGRTALWGLLGILGFAIVVFMSDLVTGRVALAKGWTQLQALELKVDVIEREDRFTRGSLDVVPGRVIALRRDGATLVELPTHAAEFAAKLAATESFTGNDARSWEPRYEWADVSRLLGILAKLDIITRAT